MPERIQCTIEKKGGGKKSRRDERTKRDIKQQKQCISFMNNKSARLSVQKRSRFSASLHKSTVRMNKSEQGDIFLSSSLSLVNNNNDLKHICSYALPANPYRAAQDNRSLALLFHILVAGNTKQSLSISPCHKTHTHTHRSIDRNKHNQQIGITYNPHKKTFNISILSNITTVLFRFQ